MTTLAIGDGDDSWGGGVSAVAVKSSRMANGEQNASSSMLKPALVSPSPSAAGARMDE